MCTVVPATRRHSPLSVSHLGEVVGTHRDMRVEVERVRTRENAPIEGARECAAAHARSMAYVEENDQCTPGDDEHAPEASQTPPEPPDKPAQRRSKSPSVELEGERRVASSCDIEHTSGDTDMSGVLTSTEETGDGRRRERKRDIEDLRRVEEKGREGEKASMRAGGHKAAVTTAGVSLAASASSQEDDGNDPEVHRTSVVPQHPQPASQQVNDTTADAANPNTTSARPTRPEDESHTPPDELPSPLLEGRRTGASTELGKLLDTESTTAQPTWTPRDDESSGEAHGVVKHHEEAASDEVEVEGGEEWVEAKHSDAARERADVDKQAH